MTSTMNSLNAFTDSIKPGFGDETGADLASFLDLSFSDNTTSVLPTASLFPVNGGNGSVAPAYSNAFSLRQEDALLESPLGLSPASLSGTPFDLSYDFTSPLLSGAFGTPDSLDSGLGTPELGHEEYPSLFYNVSTSSTSMSPAWDPIDLMSAAAVPTTSLAPTTTLGSVSPQMMSLDSDIKPFIAPTPPTIASRPIAPVPSRQRSVSKAPSASSDGVVPPKDKFSGTRNTKIKPIAFDAPTLPKNYIIPSATSRKRAPAAIANKLPTSNKKAKKTAASRDSTPVPTTVSNAYDGPMLDPDDLPDELLSAIELKRRQNTLAARRSRERKASTLAGLNDQINALTEERDEWKAKYAELEEIVRALRGC